MDAAAAQDALFILRIHDYKFGGNLIFLKKQLFKCHVLLFHLLREQDARDSNVLRRIVKTWLLYRTARSLLDLFGLAFQIGPTYPDNSNPSLLVL
jgi:hypothetical protein